MEIFQNVTGGVIMSDQSLVLQNVARATAGDYTCMATNVEGKGTSNPVKLVVRCKCKVLFSKLALLLSYIHNLNKKISFRICIYKYI